MWEIVCMFSSRVFMWVSKPRLLLHDRWHGVHRQNQKYWKTLMNDFWILKPIPYYHTLFLHLEYNVNVFSFVGVIVLGVLVRWDISLSGAVDYSSATHNRRSDQPVFCFIMHTSSPPPFSPSFRDLYGTHGQESLILRLGSPYTL